MRPNHYITAILILFAMQQGIAQNFYIDKWREVEQFELQDRIEDATQVVDEIYKYARLKKDRDQYIKVFLFKSKYQLINEEVAQYKIIAELDKMIVKAQFPNKNIYNGIRAKLLDDYARANQWKIRQRTAVGTDDVDFKTWDATKFYSEVHKSYQASLEQSEKLVKIPLSDYSAIIGPMAPARFLRPSLLDILSHQALNFYKSGYFNLTKPKEEFIITKENAFLNTTNLLKLKRPAGDTVFSKYDVMQQYAHLEAMHLNSNNEAAFIHVITDRLWYAQNQLGAYQIYEDYEKELQSIITSYDTNPAVTEAYYYLALYHQNLSNQVGEEQQYSHRQKAIQLVNKAIDLYPKSYGAALCEQLKSQMYQSSINVQVEDLIIPNRPHRGVVSYSNVEQIDLYYIKVSMDEDLRDLRFADSLYQQFIDKAIDSQNLAHKESIQLPKGDDTFNHTYEYVAPVIEKGRYVVMAKTDKADEVKYAHTFITVTNLTLFKKDSELGTALLIKDRTTGKPIEGAVVQVTYNKKSRDFKSDRDGIAMYNIKSIRGRQEVLISNNGDSLSTNYYGYYRDKNDVAVDQEIFDVKTFTYLDRAIYRPGQTVYFKAILLKKKESDKQSSVVLNELLEIYAEDVNGTEIYRTKLKTNEFGSIHGSFEIPKDVLTGEFTLYIDEPDEETAFYNTVNDWEDGEINFKVEEYKRPTFEVDFNEITETYKLGDSVTVSGFGKAFLGSNVTNATVTYKVIRSYNYARWRSGYYGNSEKVILQGETTTDADGVFKIKFLAENDKDADSEYQPLYTYKIEADLTDLNGETRSASTTMRVGTNAIQIASQLPYLFTTEKNTLKVGVKNLNGQFVNGKLIVELRKQPQASHVIIASGLPQAEFQEIENTMFRKTFPYAELRKDEIETDWKKAPIIFRKELTTDSLTTVELPITENWDNGAYYVYIKAVESDQSFDNEDDVIDSRTEKTIWANLELPLKPEIISVYSDYTEEAAIFNAFTSMNGVYATLTLWTDKELIEEKLIFLKKGKTELKYPWSQINGKQISIQLQVQKENGFEQTNMATVEKPVDPVAQYQIKTQSFRNKLQPGGEETWSFTIKDDNQIPMQAEVLASMYDKSLDEFATANWNAPLIRSYKINFNPSFFNSTIPAKTSYISFSFPYVDNYYTITTAYPYLNLHGLNFSNPKREYRNYKSQIEDKLNQLKPEKDVVVGKIIDDNGNPLYGVIIEVKGRKDKYYSDYNGNFYVMAKQGDELLFRAFGVKTASKSVNGESFILLNLNYTKNQFISENLEDYQNIMSIDFPDYGIERFSNDGMVSGNLETAMIFDDKGFRDGDSRGKRMLSPRLLVTDTISSVDFNVKASIDLKEKLDQVVARKNLQETAFFLPELRTDQDGNLEFSFTSPEALTQWKLRLLAHDKKGKTAQLEQLVVTQKELNVIPNAPRFLRETDTIRFSAKIANLSGAATDGTARLQLFDAMTMKAIDVELGNVNNNRDFTIEKDGNTSVNWTFRIPLGTQAVTYRVVAAAGNFSDGEENTLPVLSNRMLVSESRALWVRAGETQTAVMDNLLNSDSGTMAHHQMVFEYTSNPSWYAIKSLPYLMEYEHECAEQTFSRYYANAMAHHILTSNPKVKTVFDSWAQNGTNVSALEKNEELKTVMLSHTPWLRDAQSDAQKQQRLATLFDLAETAKQKKKTLAKLEKLQGDSGGFPWFNGGYTNEYITRHIASGLGHMKKLGIKNDDTPQTDRMYKNAIDALDTEWKKRFNRYLENHQTLKDYSYGNAFWHYQYARSFNVASIEKDDKLLQEAVGYAFAKAEKSYSSQPLYTKLLMAITLHRNGKTELASSILEGLKQTAVKSDENGMYWKENTNSWYWYSSDIETQALAIEAFQEVTADLNSVEELKIWLLKNKRTNQWKSTKATADATYALLLQGGKWLDVEENNKITWGNKPLPADKMKAVEKEAGTGYFKITMNAPEVYKELATVIVKNKSDVTGYGAMYWQYFEDLDKIKVDDDLPLSVKKKLFKKVMTDSGEKLEEITSEDPLKIGDLITVRLIIKTNADMDFVHLKDMRASGFEPVDVISKYKWQDGLGYYQSTKDVATHFFFDQMNKGTYVFEYDVRASNAGQFSNGITQLECIYAPEFSSHSEGMRVKIEE
ncbi:alpha-2-macroglobulin family protein [Nonlabens ulvanivorans]|uniref:alpha-2-macroglobulin family protein n=1 Tax=Nonlabens ulvanivorans TaxID=906888 RepID=UPI0037C6853D